MNNSFNITPIIYTRHICRQCLGRIYWAYVPVEAHWQVNDDGEREWRPFDWYLDIHCFCGDVTDKAVIEECYEEHRRMAGEEIRAMQNKTIVQVMGIEMAQAFNDLAGDVR